MGPASARLTPRWKCAHGNTLPNPWLKAKQEKSERKNWQTVFSVEFVTDCYSMYNTILSNSNEKRMWARDSGLSRPKTGTVLTRKHWGISSARECETMDIKLLRFYHKSQDKAYLTIWSKSQKTWHVGCLASWLTDWMGKWMDGWMDGTASVGNPVCMSWPLTLVCYYSEALAPQASCCFAPAPAPAPSHIKTI